MCLEHFSVEETARQYVQVYRAAACKLALSGYRRIGGRMAESGGRAARDLRAR